MTNYSYNYMLVADAGVQIILTKQVDTDYTITLKNGQVVNQVEVGSINNQSPTSVEITITSTASPYANAVVTCNYTPMSKYGASQSSSQCDLCFIISSTAQGGDLWAVTGHTSQGDNPSIISQTPSTIANITVIIPTSENPTIAPSSLPVLDPNMVFLLDAVGNNLLFRGNAPLSDVSFNANQEIDFSGFLSTLSKALAKQSSTESPLSLPTGEYEICVIALLSTTSEANILTPEIASFGGTIDQVSQTWYPAPTASGFPLSSLSSATGRICQWNVYPAGNTNDPVLGSITTLASKLHGWMNNGIKNAPDNVPRIFYIHCASGHDRTGMMCASYLAQKKVSLLTGTSFSDDDLLKTYIMGTTLNKLPSSYPVEGGQYVENCYDIKNATMDANRSRCFLIGDSTASIGYTQTIIWATEQIVNSSTPPTLSLPANATSGDPQNNPSKPLSDLPQAYVEPYYVWSDKF